MTLRQIEEIILIQIKADRYSSLSVDINPEKIEDFANLHRCVNLAREEIKLNTNIPAVIQIGASIPTVAGTIQYNLPIDFDIPVAMYYAATATSTGSKLTQVYLPSLPETITVSATGTPTSYLIAGTSANLLQIYLLLTPDTAGVILPVYKPVLTELTLATAEDILMRKYPKTVIDFATAFAFQIIKNDTAMHDKYYTMALAKCREIDFREVRADSNFKELPPSSIRNSRSIRLSK